MYQFPVRNTRNLSHMSLRTAILNRRDLETFFYTSKCTTFTLNKLLIVDFSH